MSLTGTEKSAILLMTLGEDRAAEVFKHLSSREVQQLSGTMASMSQVSHKQLNEYCANLKTTPNSMPR
jgi:flagellar motor switch protein FliG